MTIQSIRERRMSVQLSQVALAALSGVSRRTITRCELTNRWPRYAAQRRALCMVLGVKWAELERKLKETT